MKLIQPLFYLLILFFLFSCNSTPKQDDNTHFSIEGEWFRVQQGYNDEDSTGYENMAMHLYANGSYSYFAANYYNYGTWKWSERKWLLILSPQIADSVGTLFFEITSFAPSELEVKKLRKKGTAFVRNKIADVWFGNKNKSSGDPFLKENNLWRVKPTNPETPQQIKERTVQYLQFLKIHFQYLIDNNINNITHGWYPQPFQLNYGNLARMAYDNELNDWYACFYSKEQGIEGYKLISGIIYKIRSHNN